MYKPQEVLIIIIFASFNMCYLLVSQMLRLREKPLSTMILPGLCMSHILTGNTIKMFIPVRLRSYNVVVRHLQLPLQRYSCCEYSGQYPRLQW